MIAADGAAQDAAPHAPAEDSGDRIDRFIRAVNDFATYLPGK